ncbi:calcium-binding protein [Microbulbifer celer]|uniref:Calcium-binding protein n=1 Tax=Microbulbifer celer TaxID=435905 RepID=A0ABW3U8F1_9GAMM
MVSNDIITYEDSEGRFVVYDGKGPDNNGIVNPLDLRNFTEILPYKGAVAIGGGGDDIIYGTSFENDELIGGAGNDSLDGGDGADKMVGGLDDDIYVVDHEDDQVIENQNEGTDRVQTSITYTLSENVEELELTGSDNIDGTGNSLDNIIHGNSGDNTLQGEEGTDEIYGLEGQDIIYGGSGDDKIFGGENDDELYGDGGTDQLNGGNGSDTLKGGDGNDILDGEEGADYLYGGSGNDIYAADSEDEITDDDGKGSVYLDGSLLAGGTREEDDPENEYRDSRGNVYVLSGSTLTINDGLTIHNYSKDQSSLNIVLSDEEEEEDESPETDDAENRTSPIVIDLDGDGIETLAVGASYFDLNGDGLSELSGWVGADDGLLVHDRDGNGRISSGAELFGNHSILSSGEAAEHGFQALAEYDSNGDGVVDAQDSAFSTLQVWRDLNGNGISDAGELQSLTDSGVVSISTGYSDSDQVDAHGHEHRQVATVMLSDGTASTAADVWFKVDASRRVNSGDIELTPDVLFLPSAKGFGKVHDLRQAMTLDPDLKNLLADYVSAADDSARDALLDDLIYRWAGAADVDPYSRDPSKIYGHVMDARQLVTLENLVGRPYMGTWCWGERDPNPHGQAAPLLIAEYEEFKRFTAAQILAQTEYAEELDIIQSAFGSDAHGITVAWDQLQGRLETLLASGEAERISGVITVLTDLGTYSPSYRDKRDAAFQAIAASSVDLAPFFDFSSVIGTSEGDSLNGTRTGTIFYGLDGDDQLYGYGSGDSYHFASGHGDDVILDRGGMDQLVFGEGITKDSLEFSRNTTSVWVHVKNQDGGDAGSLRIDNFFDFDGTLDFGAVELIRFADGSSLGQSEILELLVQSSLTENDDLVFGSASGDTIDGLAGSDSVHGLAGNDQISGGAGDDVLMGDDGDDLITGGIGDDRLIGGRGSDVYQFDAGHGNDVIDNAAEAEGKRDRVVFGQGIVPSAVDLERLGDDLLIQTSTNDSIRLANYFRSEAADGTAVDEILFDDGTVWGIEDVKSLVLQASDDSDVIKGYGSNDTLDGLAGDDQLFGYAGEDTLSGGDGSDSLDGGLGDDQLFGNDGNDELRGDEGSDLLNGGAGDDRLYGGAGEDTLLGGAGQDLLRGDTGNDTLRGGDGDDALTAGAGNDLLAGGKGNDHLDGGTGTNRYLFARGDGQDVISDAYDDVVTIYVSDLSLDGLVFRRNGTDLEVTFQDSVGDQLTLTSFFPEETPIVGIRVEYGAGLSTAIDPAQLRLLTLEGTGAADLIRAYSSDDSIEALGGDDTVFAGAGNDHLQGGDGNDTLFAGDGDDLLEGGTGNDRLEGGEGSDRYQFSTGWGEDLITDTAGSDSVYFSDVEPADLQLRRDGFDLVVTNLVTGDELRVQGQFSDQAGMAGKTAIEQFEFQDGSIWNYEAIKLKALEGSGQDDSIYGHADDDAIIAGAGDDFVQAADGNDTVDGGDGLDTLHGGSGDDTLSGGGGDDLLRGGAGKDTLNGDAGNDKLYGDGGEDLLSGGDGSDELYGNGQLLGGAGDDVLWGAGTLHGGDDNDQLYGSGLLSGGAGDDLLEGIGTLDGGDGNDELRGLGSDILIGGAGDDTLIADTGTWSGSASTLAGGTGDDTLYGSFGDDIYQFNLGDGRDTLIERRDGEAYGNVDPSMDTLQFGPGIDVGDLQFIRTGDDLQIEHSNGADAITIRNWFQEPTDHYKVNRFEFAGGTLLTAADVEARTVTMGTDAAETLLGYRDLNEEVHAGDGDDKVWGRTGNDEIYGEAGDDYLDGEEGDDRLFGGDGIDNLVGRSGDDYLVGGLGGDTLQGGTGSDQLFGQDGEDKLFGGDGDDHLDGGADDDYFEAGAGNDTLLGGSGNDQLSGGVGDDQLSGGTGDDKYVFGAGDGHDEILNGDGGFDGVLFAGGLTEERLTFSRDGDDLLILVDDGSSDSVRVRDHFLGGDFAIDWVQPDGGFMISTQEINQRVEGGQTGEYDSVITGTTDGEQLVGSAGSDLIEGLGGDDTVFGMGGDDRLEGGDGADRLYGGNGGGVGTGNDVIVGGAGNDVLSGGDGDDQLFGGAGDDDYYYAAGHGVDVIDNSGGGTDGVFFVDGLERSRLSYHRDGDDLVILVDGDLQQQVRVTDHFLGGDYAITYIQPDDGGYSIPAADLDALLTPMPDGSGGGDNGGGETDPGDGEGDEGSGGDSEPAPEPGLGGDDTINGTAASDTLVAGSGNDTLSGGAGNDRLLGGEGDDVYVFTGGQDLIEESSGTDTLKFAAGITFNQVASGLLKSGDDLVLRVGGGTDQVTLKDFFLGGDALVETIEFESGGQLTAEQIFGAFGLPVPAPQEGYAQTLDGSAGDDAALDGGAEADLIRGFNGNDQLSGASGDDHLEGGNGADILSGGSGDDQLIGGRGDDLYVFNAGDGQDVIDNTGGGLDVLRFEDIGFNDVASGLQKSGDNLVLQVSGGSDQVTLRDFFKGGDHAIDRIEFSSGGELTADQIFGAFGLSNPDPVGSPDYQGLPDERGFGTLTVGSSADEIILASSDADFIDAGAGSDQLHGNLGDDYLVGGEGDDTYHFAAGGGVDTINNFSNSAGNDELQFADGIDESDLWFHRDGDDLVVDLLGTQDQVRVQDWYLDPANQLDAVRTDDAVITASEVEQLVTAMAAFGAPAGGELNLTPEDQSQVNTAIVAAWQASA